MFFLGVDILNIIIVFYLFNWDLFIVVVCLDLLFEVFEESIFLVVMYGMFMIWEFLNFFLEV